MPFRYVILCPDVSGSSGGVAVLYDLVALLQRQGHPTILAHASPSGSYTNTPHDLSASYTREIRKIHIASRKWPFRMFNRAQLAIEDFVGGPNKKLNLSSKDVLIVPDFWIAEAARAFPRNKKILFIQNSFALFRAYANAEDRGLDPKLGVIGAVGISDTCIDALSMLDYHPIFRCPVAPNLSIFPYTAHKSLKIAYMPRKRPLEARIAMSALRRRNRLGQYEINRIDGMSQLEVAGILREARIFVSFMKNEALGFPAMEAMSAGCIVIGFTGLGTEEYFTPETGIPIPDGDLVKLVQKVESTIEAYDNDPEPLDRMRERASQTVHARYGGTIFEDKVREIWKHFSDLASLE